MNILGLHTFYSREDSRMSASDDMKQGTHSLMKFSSLFKIKSEITLVIWKDIYKEMDSTWSFTKSKYELR